MKYSDLLRPTMGGTISIGRGRELPVRLLSPAEDAALRRAIPEPDAPVMKTDAGEPMVDGQGRLVRDDGSAAFTSAISGWGDRFRAARIAIALGLESQCGKSWSRSKLSDPADGHVRMGGEQLTKVFDESERTRRNYCVAVIADMLGDDERDGLVTLFELEVATEQYKKIGFTELVAASAEGNSGSAPAKASAGAPTND